RIDWDDVKMLIDTKRYFILHAPRQTGKTSTLLAIKDSLNNSKEYRAVYANIEAVQTARSNVERGIPSICTIIARSINACTGENRVTNWFYENSTRIPVDDLLTQMLQFWSQLPAPDSSKNLPASDSSNILPAPDSSNRLTTPDSSKKIPAILLLDEVDALVGDTLISLLRQIRAGYTDRPSSFPQSIILCGVRDVRDYRMKQPDGEIITGGSAFNIKAKSLRMGNFTE
ncbi:AAA-like domain-containing protein, partial [Desulfamplus magnetovallimortis]|uniref:AAA-like domain-containing protein n=1 Tax=Desulfamplus magnetovallimortis TaxID=1246637 RepID=UPI001C96C12A